MGSPHRARRGRTRAALLSAALIASAGTTAAWGDTVATTSGTTAASPNHRQAGEDSGELMDSMRSFNDPRVSPGGTITAGAYRAAWQHVLGMPVRQAAFTEATTQPYNGDALHYRDHNVSNGGTGGGYNTGRIAALATDPTHPGVVYAGGAGGGVFRSTDDGATWTPIADHLPSLSVGSLAVAADGALWLGTGEATTAFDNYLGTGVYRLANPSQAAFSQSDALGGGELDNSSIHALRFDTEAGYAFAATSHGVYRRALGAAQGDPWQKVLAPCAGTGIGGITCGTGSYYADIANDLVVQPGSGGKRLVANLAWRGGATYNGFYYSDDAGTTWHTANPQGGINPGDIGNTTFAYSADGSKLYAVVESPTLYNKNPGAKAPQTVLGGVYVSNSGDINGPFTQIATSSVLANSGSAMKLTVMGPGYQPGVQSWYDQSLAVDPTDPNHLYLGLEELYETHNGGSTWNTVGRYWNLGLNCFSYDAAQNTCDGNVMHSDQHALAFSSWPGRAPEVYAGNDGGVYARPTTQTAPGWRNLNASGTLRTLQYYSVGAGALPGGGEAVWGGLQDNGVSVSVPQGATYSYTYPGTTAPVTEQLNAAGEMGQPFGGDGGDQLVNPANGCQTVGEYTNLAMSVTTNCGYTANADGTPSAITSISPNDPNARFIAPFGADAKDPGYWVAGGEYVYADTRTWQSTSGSDWQKLADSGAGHSVTAVKSQRDANGNHVVWAAWCGNCNPGADFARGIMTNYGGSWHQVALPADFPVRYVQDVAIDPADPTGATAYAALSGFSRHWNVGPGAGYGHLWRTTDGGASWQDVSGADGAADQLVDASANRLLFAPDGTLVLATDLGVFTDDVKADGLGHWKRLGLTDATAGGNLPTAAAVYLTPSPDGGSMYVATHGRGIWKTAMP
ncbi:glycosyl hydrolase [Kitasatospora sp. NPDC094028]